MVLKWLFPAASGELLLSKVSSAAAASSVGSCMDVGLSLERERSLVVVVAVEKEEEEKRERR